MESKGSNGGTSLPRRAPDFLEDAEADGNTPIDPDEAEGLIPDLVTRGALNAWEQTNILKAEEWAFSRRRGDILTTQFVMKLHRRMFEETWTWAGTLRRSDKNFGVHWATIPENLRQVLDNTAYWVEHSTYSKDEIAVRLHHTLVAVHPFPNGNGRHSRLMADLLARKEGVVPFTWGRGNLIVGGRVRILYLEALRQADRGDIRPLLGFARS